MSRLSLQWGQEVNPHLFMIKPMDLSIFCEASLAKPLEFLLVVCARGFEKDMFRVAHIMLA